jgi:hypothetical protein
MSDKLDKNILATIVYYDVLNYSLTAFEVWKYLIRTDYYVPRNESLKITFAQVANRLQDKEFNKYVEHASGFYFLRGRKELVEKRIANNKISIGKIRRLQRIVWWLRFLPFVRMVGITGALAMKNAKFSSDLDLLIVLKYGKIWTGRTLVTGALHFFKQRRHGKNISDRVCLNFFVTDQSLEVITKDLFSANEYMFLFPLYGWDAYTKFQIKNQWIKNMKPSYALGELAPLKTMTDSFASRFVRKVAEFVFSPKWIEQALRKIERGQIMRNPKTHQEGSLVYANDDALVFLPDPHGPAVFEKFKEKIEELSA